MARDGIKLIIYRCGPCKGHFQSIGFHQYEFSNKPACLKCTFSHPVCQKFIFRNPVSPKPYFHVVGELQSSFHAFGLSKVYLYCLVMARSRLFTFYNSFLMNLMSSLWIFQQESMSEVHFHASNLSKIFYLGYPVCPKTIFLGIRLVCSSFFMRSVCPKSISNGSWWYKVDYLQMWTL